MLGQLPSQVRLIAISCAANAQCLCATNVDEWIQAFSELQVVSFQLLLVFLLIMRDEVFVLLESIVAPGDEN